MSRLSLLTVCAMLAVSVCGEDSSTASMLELRKDGVTAQIDSVSGLLGALRFNDVELQPKAADNSVIFVKMGEQETAFRARETPMRSDDTVTVTLFPDDASVPFLAQVEYRIEDGFFTEKVILTAQKEVKHPVQLGVRHGFNPDSWDRIICALYPMRAIGSHESTLFSYREKENDLNSTKLDKYQYVIYPLTMLEGPKGILLAGSFDLDRFVTMAPNHPQGYFPSLQLNPLSARAGDKFEFV